MQITIFSVWMTFVWCNIFIVLCYILRKRSVLLNLSSMTGIIILYLFCLIRLAVPVELPWTKVVSGGSLYNFLYQIFGCEITCVAGHEIYVYHIFVNLTETEARNALGAFMFTGEDVFKNIDMLSGGEKVRLALCKILKRRPNVLVLDEPTNHMDIVGKETLESMLKDFSGTLIFVSHDRYFVRKVANRLLVFEDGTTHLYQFGYEEYQEKLDREAAESGDDYRKNPAALGGAISQNGGIQQSKGTQETGGKKAYYNPGKERSKIEKKVKKAEEELAVKEEKLDALKQELLRPEYQSSYSKLTEIQGEIDALEEEIMADMENWEALSQQLEELES